MDQQGSTRAGRHRRWWRLVVLPVLGLAALVWLLNWISDLSHMDPDEDPVAVVDIETVIEGPNTYVGGVWTLEGALTPFGIQAIWEAEFNMLAIGFPPLGPFDPPLLSLVFTEEPPDRVLEAFGAGKATRFRVVCRVNDVDRGGIRTPGTYTVEAGFCRDLSVDGIE